MTKTAEDVLREHAEELFKEQSPRTDLDELERLSEEAAKNPKRSPWSDAKETQRMPRPDAKTVRIKSPRGAVHRFRSWASRTLKSNWKKIGVAGVAGLVLGSLAFFAFEWAVDQTQEKIGPASDLSGFLPSQNNVLWISAPFMRTSRDDVAPYYEPNVVNEDVTVISPQDGVLVFGILLQGLPEEFSNDIDVNEFGKGNSDWLCEPYDAYLICQSTSGAYPLVKDIGNVVSMQFHLPGDEVREMLKQKSGTRQVYIVVS